MFDMVGQEGAGRATRNRENDNLVHACQEVGLGDVMAQRIPVGQCHCHDFMAAVQKPPLSGSGYSGYPPSTVPDMLKSAE